MLLHPTRFVYCGTIQSADLALPIMEYVQIMTTGNALDFGDLTHQLVGGHGGLFKWSWRFRIMSDIKINNITDRSGNSGTSICWYIHSINICIYGDAKW